MLRSLVGSEMCIRDRRKVEQEKTEQAVQSARLTAEIDKLKAKEEAQTAEIDRLQNPNPSPNPSPHRSEDALEREFEENLQNQPMPQARQAELESTVLELQRQLKQSQDDSSQVFGLHQQLVRCLHETAQFHGAKAPLHPPVFPFTAMTLDAVSYTHLTLPTKRIV
eukprot:TRINITY_DN18143_c0_g1_i1.p1 TRINITY_DN18143_c0_g1~~TRINITY_DN18143_c0_g1_i1.p1  ORF type:complete len:166 (+),score=44.30 TRINITY_DN18143_c0_g1_i1:121-618(+)